MLVFWWSFVIRNSRKKIHSILFEKTPDIFVSKNGISFFLASLNKRLGVENQSVEKLSRRIVMDVAHPANPKDIAPIFLGLKTFIFHGFCFQRYGIFSIFTTTAQLVHEFVYHQSNSMETPNPRPGLMLSIDSPITFCWQKCSNWNLLGNHEPRLK